MLAGAHPLVQPLTCHEPPRPCRQAWLLRPKPWQARLEHLSLPDCCAVASAAGLGPRAWGACIQLWRGAKPCGERSLDGGVALPCLLSGCRDAGRGVRHAHWAASQLGHRQSRRTIAVDWRQVVKGADRVLRHLVLQGARDRGTRGAGPLQEVSPARSTRAAPAGGSVNTGCQGGPQGTPLHAAGQVCRYSECEGSGLARAVPSKAPDRCSHGRRQRPGARGRPERRGGGAATPRQRQPGVPPGWSTQGGGLPPRQRRQPGRCTHRRARRAALQGARHSRIVPPGLAPLQIYLVGTAHISKKARAPLRV